MRFAAVLFCWVGFFGWDLAANDGAFMQAIGTRIFHLMHVTGLL
jgi:hypothetical protein